MNARKIFFTFCIIWSAVVPQLSAEVLLDSSGRPVKYAGTFNPARVEIKDVLPKKNEFRGIWVAMVENIDFPPHKTAYSFQKDFCKLADTVKAAGFTAIIFQVRSNCDALYPSRLAPWSRWLTGTEGAHLGNFDPLKFMVDETHKRGMEFHAWFNPYRVTGKTKLSKQAYLSSLTANNFARKNPQWVLCKKHPDGNQLFLDPGVPQVVTHLRNIVYEVIIRYNIDAVHFDDYFYPYEQLGNEDNASFSMYKAGFKDKNAWRRNNTYSLIKTIKQTIDSVNRSSGRKIEFGVSPFGIWANRKNNPYGSLTNGKESFYTLHADTRLWVQHELIDYIAPQIYWSFDNKRAPYAALTDWWCSTVNGTSVKLYIGIGAYNSGQWQKNELINQLRFNRMRNRISGMAFFSYRSFFGETANLGTAALLWYLKKKDKK